jgi:hypothetical protein
MSVPNVTESATIHLFVGGRAMRRRFYAVGLRYASSMSSVPTAACVAVALALAGCPNDGGTMSFAADVDGKRLHLDSDTDWQRAVAARAAATFGCARASLTIGPPRWAYIASHWTVSGCGRKAIFVMVIQSCPPGMGTKTCEATFVDVTTDAPTEGSPFAWLAALLARASEDLACTRADLEFSHSDLSSPPVVWHVSGCKRTATYGVITTDAGLLGGFERRRDD